MKFSIENFIFLRSGKFGMESLEKNYNNINLLTFYQPILDW